MTRLFTLSLLVTSGLLAFTGRAAAEEFIATQSVVRASSSTRDTIALGNSTNGTALGRNRFVFETAFIFDLSTLSAPFDAVTFSFLVKSATSIAPGGDWVDLYDVSTPASVLSKDQMVPSGPFADLSSGIKYGEALISSADVLTRVTFTLSSAALSDIYAAANPASPSLTEPFVIGASFRNLPASGNHYFVVSDAKLTTSEIASVPEPVTAVFGIGLACLAVGSRRRRS